MIALDPTLMRSLLAGVVPPAACALGALAVTWRPWSRERSGAAAARAWRARGAPLALGWGYAAGHVGTHGWPPSPAASDVKQTLCWLAIGVGLLGLAPWWRNRGSGWIRWAGLALVAFAVPWALLGFMREHHWHGIGVWLWSAGLGLAILAWLAALEGLARRRSGADLPLAWTLASLATSGALFWGRSASLAQLTGSLATGLGIVWLVTWRKPHSSLAGGGALAVGVLVAGLLLAGRFAAELREASALCAAGAFLAPWLGELGAWRRSPRTRRLIALGGVLLASGSALWLAHAALPEDPYAAYR